MNAVPVLSPVSDRSTSMAGEAVAGGMVGAVACTAAAGAVTGDGGVAAASRQRVARRSTRWRERRHMPSGCRSVRRLPADREGVSWSFPVWVEVTRHQRAAIRERRRTWQPTLYQVVSQRLVASRVRNRAPGVPSAARNPAACGSLRTTRRRCGGRDPDGDRIARRRRRPAHVRPD